MPQKNHTSSLTLPMILEAFNIRLAPKTVPVPVRIIKQGPATIVFWNDETKTVVKRAKEEPDDDYNAFTAALTKKIYGSNNKIKNYLKIVETIRK